MREIKFRAWNKKYKYMNYFDIYELGKDRAPIEATEYLYLMQYTGLKDKNGKEIYEGDVVRFKQEYPEETISHGIGKVEWRVDSYVIIHVTPPQVGHITFMNWDEMEIIGNIYENPELLK